MVQEMTLEMAGCSGVEGRLAEPREPSSWWASTLDVSSTGVCQSHRENRVSLCSVGAHVYPLPILCCGSSFPLKPLHLCVVMLGSVLRVDFLSGGWRVSTAQRAASTLCCTCLQRTTRAMLLVSFPHFFTSNMELGRCHRSW